MAEIHYADPTLRRKLAWGIALLLIATLFSQRLFVRFTDWVAEDPKQIEERVNYLIGAIAIAFSPLFLFGYFTWKTGSVIVAAKRFPSPKMKVIFDTVILKGQKAVLRGRLMQLVGAILWGTAIGFPIAFGYTIKSIINNS